MAEKIKYTRKDLKGPDKFISRFGQIMAWSKENTLKITAGALVVVAVLALIFGGRAYFQWQEQQASAEIWPYLKKVTQASGEDLQTVEQTITSLASKYKGTVAALFAHYYLGNIAYARGDYDEGISRYNEAIKKTGRKDDLLKFLLNMGIGSCYEAKGDNEAAAQSYGKAAETAGSSMKVIALFDKARALELALKKDEAIALYRQIMEENPESIQKDLIEIKIASME